MAETRKSKLEYRSPKLILASASLRRAEILREAGIAFEALPVAVDETPQSGETAEALVRRLAEAKARAGAEKISGAAAVLGADTEVVVDGAVLGKPADADDARRMLRQLSGRAHEVITGVALLALPGGTLRVEVERSRVTFAALSDADIEAYVATGEPMDKAGAYAIQGGAAKFVIGIEGSYSNVVGLPVELVGRMLQECRV